MRVDLERLARLLDLLLLAEVLDLAEVVETVGQLDQDDPHVLGHRNDHLAVVLGLGLLAALERDPRQLSDAVDEARDLVAELGPEVVDVGVGVLDDVVEERGRDRLLVEPELGEDLRDAPGMVDELLAGTSLLPLVGFLREAKRPGDQVAVDRRVVGRDGLQQLVDEPLIPLGDLDSRHCKQCTPGLRRRPSPNGPFGGSDSRGGTRIPMVKT
jgi:hypothetical protein